MALISADTRQYDTRDGNCDLCGGDPVQLGPALRIVYWDMTIHKYGAEGCRGRKFLMCRWCHLLRVRIVERGDGRGTEQRWPCPECYPMEPEQRAEIILRRSGGEPPWQPGE